MAFETVDSPDCPVPQRKLLIAAGLFTKELAQIAHPAAAIARIATAENMLYVIWLRLLQMSRSIQSSCYLGYAHEQQGLVRSMVSAASDLIYIAGQPNAASAAMLYAAYSVERRRKIGKGYLKIGLMSQEMHDKWDQVEDEKERKAFEEAKRHDITPAPKHKPKKGDPAPTWSGLRDADMIGNARRNWYAAYYVPFSDMAHANVMTAEEEMNQLQAGSVTIGPRFPARILAYIITGVVDTMSAGIEIIDGHFSLAKAGEVGAHQRAMLAALQEYRDTLPPSPLESADV